MKKLLFTLVLLLSYNSYSQLDGVRPSNVYFLNGENISGDNNFIEVPDDAYWRVSLSHHAQVGSTGGILEFAYFDTATENYVYPPVQQSSHDIVTNQILPEKTRIWIHPNNQFDFNPDILLVRI